MLRSSSKIKVFGALVSLVCLPVFNVMSVVATQVDRNTNFIVNVGDALAVSITNPETWAVGDVDEFLRNRIIVSATTNCAAGLTATMYTKTSNTNLINTKQSTYTIPTLASTVTLSGSDPGASFPANYWGYSIDDTVAAPDEGASYDPLSGPSAPITLIQTNQPGAAGPQDVFFGAKANMTKASGTYASTVVISVVTGVVEEPEEPSGDPEEPSEDPVEPSNDPVEPSNTPSNTPVTPNNVAPSYTANTTPTDVEPSSTEPSNGDVISSYENPQGVRRRTTSSSTEVSEGSPLATGLAVTSAVAGATGFIFFLIGKRRKDEEEEEEGTGEQQPPIQG